MQNTNTEAETVDQDKNYVRPTASYYMKKIFKGLAILLFGIVCIAALVIGIGAIAGWMPALAATAWLAVALSSSTIAIALTVIGGIALLSAIGVYLYSRSLQKSQNKQLSLISSHAPEPLEFPQTEQLQKTAYLYYQGKSCSQTQAAKYIGHASMMTTTGEIAKANPPGILTIPSSRLWVYPEIEEVDRHALLGWSGRLTQWVERIEVKVQVASEHKPASLYQTNETGSVYSYSVLTAKSSLGQSTDIAAHRKKYDALMEQIKPENVIVCGASRGAATTFSALATHKDNYGNVKLCIIEGPPSSISHLFKFYFSRFLGKLLYNRLIASLFLGAKHALDKELQARGHVDKFPNNVPLVVVSSIKDKIVPHSSSIRLALRVAVKRLKAQEQGETEVAPVYFLQLDKPPHHDYARGNQTDAQRYLNFIHAVYKKHDLPHIAEYAALGEIDLNTADLVNGPLKQQVQSQAKFWEQKEQRQQIRQQAYQNLQETKSDTEKTDNIRSLSIAAYMPLFSKHRSASLGGRTSTHKKIDLLITN